MMSALLQLINVKQGVNEQLLDYLKWFKQLRDNMKSYLGDKALTIFIE